MGFIAELQRRNVLRSVFAYIAICWLIIEAAELILGAFDAPSWIIRALIIITAIGIVPTAILSWMYEFTERGIVAEDEAGSAGLRSVLSDRRIDFAIIGVLAVALSLMVIERQVGTDVIVDDENQRVSIAVLPFVNMSTDSENGFFADGLSEELLNLLTEVKQLAVASRTSAFSFKGKTIPLTEIASALGVQHILEGSVRRDGSQLRITAQLIHADSDRHLWSKTYDRDMAEIFAVQDEIASEIVGALQKELGVTVGDGEVSHESLTHDLEAYDLFLKGRELWRLRGKGNLEQAMVLLKQAVDRDPDFSEAWSMLSASYIVYPAWSGNTPEFWYPLAREAANRAITVDPMDAMAHAVLGTVELASGDMTKAISLMRKARELDPFGITFHQWTGEQSLFLGHTRDADQSYRVAVTLDPLAPQVYFLGASVANQQGDMQTALERERRARELGAVEALDYIFQTPLFLGEYARAREILEGGREHLERRNNAIDYATLSAIVDALEDPSHIEQAVAEIRRSTGVTGFIDPLAIRALGYLNQYEAAADLIETYGLNNDTWLISLWAADTDLITHPRIQSLLQASRLMDVWKALGPPDRCSLDADVLSCT